MPTVPKPTADEIAGILADHARWLRGEDGGKKADLTRADLAGANLTRADLAGANLTRADLAWANLAGADLAGANLAGADLAGANLTRADLAGATLPEGIAWEQYLAEVVPALLASGGKSIESLLTAGVWDCHSWTNCPMAAAFEVDSLAGVPILLRPRANEFVRFFDACLIPTPRRLTDGSWTCLPATTTDTTPEAQTCQTAK